MGGACGMYGEAKTVYRVMARKREGDLEGIGLHGRIILKWILNYFGGRGME